MTQRLQSVGVSAPGFYGLNTQDAPLDISAGFALIANNCVIDQYGRIGARKGWSKVNSSSGNLGANDAEVIHELVQSDGTLTTLFAGNNKLFKLDGSNAVVELTYGGGGTAPTITDNNWSCASLSGITYFFQLGHDPLIFDPAVSTTTYRRVSEKSGYAGTVPEGNICISAFGRLWIADTSTNKTTVTFSDLLAGHIYSGGTSGTLNVNSVWPNGADQVTGLAAHNNFLIIFGKRQILVYSGATTPSTMTLSDTVGGIGCIARDSVQATNTDVIFLSNTGVRSIMRTIQEKSAPFSDVSKNIRNDLMTDLSGEVLANVKAVYSDVNAFYLLTVPSVKAVYVFDTRTMLQDSSLRVTKWDSIEPKSFCAKRNGDLLIGKTGYIGKYGTYLDDTANYRLSYYTNYSDIGDVNITSILKGVHVVVIGGSNQYLTIKWGYDFSQAFESENVLIPTQGTAEYGVNEYGSNSSPLSEYASGISIQTLTVQATGSGKIIQLGFETDISGTPLSIQKLEMQAKHGRLS